MCVCMHVLSRSTVALMLYMSTVLLMLSRSTVVLLHNSVAFFFANVRSNADADIV